MDFKKISKKWSFVIKENKILRYSIIILIISNFYFGYKASDKNEIVVIHPFEVNETVKISKNGASDNLLKDWGLFFSELIGNVTPKSAEYIRETIEKYFDSSVYHQINLALQNQIEDLQESQVTISFSPKHLHLHKPTKTVFVTGDAMIYSYYDSNKIATRETRTYEFRIEFQNYQPKIVHFATYLGKPQIKKYEDVK